MADESKKAEAAKAQEKAKSGGVMKTVLMVGIPLMLVQTGIAYVVISKFVAAPAAVAVAEVAEETNEGDEQGMLYMVEDLIVNPAGTNGTRFLNTSIALEYYEKKLESELAEKNVMIRDVILSILLSKTLDELDGVANKDSLRSEILDKCNQKLRNGKLTRVYFTNFVMQ